MLAPATRKSVVMLSAVALLSAGGATVWFSDLTPISRGNPENLLSLLRDRSPGQRAAGAQSAKQPRTSAVLSASNPPAKLRPGRTSAVLPLTVSPAASVPAIAGVATPIPFAATPVAAFAPAALGSPLAFPPLFLPGGDDISRVVVNPPGAGPSPVPGVPEPGAWAMMIIGFGLVGGILRRRRRLTAGWAAQARPIGQDPVALASTGAV